MFSRVSLLNPESIKTIIIWPWIAISLEYTGLLNCTFKEVLVPFSFRLTTQPFMLQLTRGTMVCYSCYYRQKLLLRIQGSLASKIRYRFLNSAWGNGGSGMGGGSGVDWSLRCQLNPHPFSPSIKVYLPCCFDSSFYLAQSATLR